MDGKNDGRAWPIPIDTRGATRSLFSQEFMSLRRNLKHNFLAFSVGAKGQKLQASSADGCSSWAVMGLCCSVLSTLGCHHVYTRDTARVFVSLHGCNQCMQPTLAVCNRGAGPTWHSSGHAYAMLRQYCFIYLSRQQSVL